VQGNWNSICAVGISSALGVGNRIAANTLAHSGFAIVVLAEFGPSIAENRILGTADWGITCGQMMGRCEIIENRLSNCGTGSPLGIAALLVLGEMHVEANEVVNTGVSADGTPAATPAIGILGLGILEARVEANLVTYSDVTQRPAGLEDRALWMMGLYDYRTEYRLAPTQVIDQSLGFAVQIANNKFIGPGQSALVELAQVKWFETATDILSISFYSRFERVLFNNNYCLHFTGTVDLVLFWNLAPVVKGGTVVFCGRTGSVTGNQIRAAAAPTSAAPGFMTVPGFPSIDFNGVPGPCIGNVTSGPIMHRGTAPPLDPSFNMRF
jgi:hypothetical protein